MGQFILSPEAFKTIEADAKHSDKIKSIQTTSDVSGVIETNDVTIDYIYNPTSQVLSFNIGKKHSLAAKMASDNIIEHHIVDVLFHLEKAPAVSTTDAAVAKSPFTVKKPIPNPNAQTNPVANNPENQGPDNGPDTNNNNENESEEQVA